VRIGVETISAGRGFSASAGGMIVYYHGLLSALAAIPGVERIVVFVTPWNRGLGIPRNPKIVTVVCSGVRPSRAARVLYEQTVLPWLVHRSAVDALLCTTNTMPLLSPVPTVVVLQSLQYLFFPESFSALRLAYLRAFVPISLKRAAAVITVSNWQRDKALRTFGLDSERVFAVHHGVSEIVRAGLSALNSYGRSNPARPYILMVSSLYRFKNHDRLIRAFARVIQKHGVPHELLIAGGDADVTATELGATARRAGIETRVRLLGPVPHDDVARLLAGADAVAYVSLFETFGHPVLEALAFGRPVVASNVTAIPEVAADAAVLVDPYDVESIADGLASALLDDALRARLADAGPRRAASFTWASCAAGTFAALESAARSAA
jgi:glycosyltransferase involved in cell wall biosynthesis